MSVSKGYDGAKVAPIVKNGEMIRVTKEWLQANVKDKSAENELILKNNLLGVSICPRAYRFKDVPAVRSILGIGK